MTIEQQRRFVLFLSCIPSIGSVRLKAILTKYHSINEIQSSSIDSIQSTPGIGLKSAQTIVSFLKYSSKEAMGKVEKQLELMEKWNTTLITIYDNNYPISLLNIYDAPAYFFLRGKSDALNGGINIAIVGTRAITPYGKKATEVIASQLAGEGITIVSGMAYGVDKIAHEEACKKNAPTIAVLGCGVDNIYTDPTNKLTPHILENGAIISEEFIGTPPIGENFPKRNRIISGLSKAVIIIESDLDGGAMITANYALEQGRDVFALPGSIFSTKSNGTNSLIQKGAMLIRNTDDILQEINFKKKNSLSTKNIIPPKLTNDEKLIFDVLKNEPKHIDNISEDTDLDITSVQLTLFDLENKGVVEMLVGKKYQLKQ